MLGVFEGKLLGHIVSKEGVRIDPDRVQGIRDIQLSKTKQAIQSFFGRINFLRRFILNFAEVAKPISNMLKKDHSLKWSDEAKRAFKDIKDALCQASVLASPNYDKDF